MYIRTNEGQTQELTAGNRLSGSYFGESPVSSQAISIDVKLAVSQNNLYQKMLKWDSQVGQIKSFLMRTLSLPSISSPEDFARAVATWQNRYGSEKKPDGVIGPITWAKLQSAMKAASPPPVSPSQVSAIPNADKEPKYLAVGIFEAEYMTVEAWQWALNEFGVIMNAVSDAEGTVNFAGVLKKHITDKLLDTIAGAAPPGVVAATKTVTGFLDALVAENQRAEQAREGAQLRDFIVRFSRRLNDAKVAMSATKDDYFHLVEKNYATGTEVDKSAYKKQLVEYLDRLDGMRQAGWLTGKRLFALLAFEWIRNTKKKWPQGFDALPSVVQVWVDYADNVTKAFIMAPGGQKIAEQFLKDADGAGLRPYEWPVRRIIMYYNKDKYQLAISYLTATGELDLAATGPRLRQDHATEVLADLKFKRLLAQLPTTKDVEGA
jgi:hypothetical protein